MTREMLEDRGTLQFILDTVYKLGGAPQKLNLAQEESMYNIAITNNCTFIGSIPIEFNNYACCDH